MYRDSIGVTSRVAATRALPQREGRKYCPCGYRLWQVQGWPGICPIQFFWVGDEPGDSAHLAVLLKKCPRCQQPLSSLIVTDAPPALEARPPAPAAPDYAKIAAEYHAELIALRQQHEWLQHECELANTATAFWNEEWKQGKEDYKRLRQHYDAVKEAAFEYMAELSEWTGFPLLCEFVAARLQMILNAVPRQEGGEINGGHGVVPEMRGAAGGWVLPCPRLEAVPELRDPCQADTAAGSGAQTAP